MDKPTAIRIFESLASGVRLDVYRLLVRQGEGGMVAGAIAQALGIPANSLSFHLKAMTHAGMVFAEQEGRFVRYRADLPRMLALIGYLTEECCAGEPGKCVELHEPPSCPPADAQGTATATTATATAAANRKKR